ncbi:MAG: DUF1385 domain-containing protein [Dehalococcoidia bacterium]|nr:MAG: DUF1385 domain-containing protein [Dehalococcoidia bacterium]
MPSSSYGGQAVIEGVMMRGAQVMSVAVRAPTGAIVSRDERLGGVYTNAARRIPLLRGITILAETVMLGTNALTWSAAVAAGETEEDGQPKRMGIIEWLFVLGAMAFAIGVFFVGPVIVTSPLDGRWPTWAVIALEGSIRMGLLLGYVWGIGRTEGVRRVFQYHGAEHMTIAAYEDGRELTVPAIRRYPKEHPRCGTSFLLTVALVSIVVFAFAGREPLWWRFASRLILVPLVAAVSYEAIRFAGAHQRWPVIRWLFAGNIALQYLTTRPPDDEQIQVAVAAFERVRQAEARTP